MIRDAQKTDWAFLLGAGSLWGLSEAVAGMALRGACSRMITGSLMTGAAVFFLSAGYSRARRVAPLALMLGLATLYKLLDALFLRLPVLHGAVANPIFAFYTEVFAFALVVGVIRERLADRIHGQALLGGLAALVAVNLFPLVRFATGIPACVYPGTGYPLALYYAPLAVAVSAAACPLGIHAARLMETFQARSPRPYPQVAAALVPVVSLALFLIIRI